jgi:electron transfer flavoprotein alpha subunit
MPVLVYVENTGGQFKKSTFEVVSYSKAIADALSTTLTAVSIGTVAEAELSELGKYGANKVMSANSEKFNAFSGKPYASTIAQAAKKENAEVIVLSNSFNGKAIAPSLSVQLNAGIASSAIETPRIEKGHFIVKTTAFSGKAFADKQLLSETKIITLSPNAFQAKENPVQVVTERFEPELKESDFRISVKEVVKATDKVPLPEAEIVISGGRGLKGPENWHLIENLAEVLGGVPACSKPVSDAGWRPHEEHVGQTGITISPNLYVAIGISGAIQHLAGVNSSKTILVINKDPEAPFFKVADYGIVGDAFEVVPKLIEVFKDFKAKG